MTQKEQCWATATVSNLGVLYHDVPLPKNEGRIQLGADLELIGVESVPPVRAWTALGVCATTYANRLSVNLHYDSAVLTSNDAEELLNGIVAALF
jgi:hypothetical protein